MNLALTENCLELCVIYDGGPPLVSGFVRAYNSTVLGSNPKPTIYTLIVKFCTLFVITLSKGRKCSKRGQVCTFDKGLFCYLLIIVKKYWKNKQLVYLII